MRITILLVLTFFSSTYLFAEDYESEPKNTFNSERDTSDATFDKRLPPVIPGERISDGKRTIKVWSTAGPVPVSSITQAPDNTLRGRRRNQQQPLNVIVDGRK